MTVTHLYFVAFNAALAICGCIQASRPIWDCPELLPPVEVDAAFGELDRAVNIFDALNEGHSTVTKCKACLEELMQMIKLLPNQGRLHGSGLSLSHSSRLSGLAPPAMIAASSQGMQPNSNASAPNNGHSASSLMAPGFMLDTELDGFLFPIEFQTGSRDLSTVDPFLI